LLLGLPCGSADLEFELDENFQNPNVNVDELFNSKLCNIVGRVIERNQSENSRVYATTQNIDEALEQLHNDMPTGWWEIPAFIPNDGSLEAVQIFNRITQVQGNPLPYALVVVTLQIAYLPTLYSEFNRRENEVSLLNARAGVPSWGPELLARTHYALGSGASTIDTLPDLYAQWERWAAEVAESHTTYLPLVRFRSPRPLSSWVTALLAVLDSAALYLALSPQSAPVVPARLCLRSGFDCLARVAQAMDLDVPEVADPAAGISLGYDEFLNAVARMQKVDFPIERDPAEAWPDFVGWRVNYEQAAYAVAAAVDAVPAMWSGPRRHQAAPIAPLRPLPGRPPK